MTKLSGLDTSQQQAFWTLLTANGGTPDDILAIDDEIVRELLARIRRRKKSSCDIVSFMDLRHWFGIAPNINVRFHRYGNRRGGLEITADDESNSKFLAPVNDWTDVKIADQIVSIRLSPTQELHMEYKIQDHAQ